MSNSNQIDLAKFFLEIQRGGKDQFHYVPLREDNYLVFHFPLEGVAINFFGTADEEFRKLICDHAQKLDFLCSDDCRHSENFQIVANGKPKELCEKLAD